MKQFGLNLQWNPHPRIPNRKVQKRISGAARLQADVHHHFPLLRELDRIPDQVQQPLPQPQGIAHDFERHLGSNAES